MPKIRGMAPYNLGYANGCVLHVGWGRADVISLFNKELSPISYVVIRYMEDFKRGMDGAESNDKVDFQMQK